MRRKRLLAIFLVVVGMFGLTPTEGMAAVETAGNNCFGVGAGGIGGGQCTLGDSNSFFGGSAGTSAAGSSNSIFGFESGMSIHAAGINNSFFGRDAGRANTFASDNSFFGRSAGRSNITGTRNSFFGTGAGNASDANDNSFFGYFAGVNTTAGGNSFFGRSAGQTNISGTNNAFFGGQSGLGNTSGGSNSFFGYQSGQENTAGNINSFFGQAAGFRNHAGSGNSFFGREAGFNNEDAADNSFFGLHAGRSNTASGNSFFGARAGDSNTSGVGNSIFGTDAGGNNITGFNNSFFGQDAGRNNSSGASNSFFGQQAGFNNTGGTNSFFGSGAGFNNIGGGANSFFGTQAGVVNTTGNFNSFFGRGAGLSNTTESANSFIGANSNGAAGITNATAIGRRAQVSQSNSLVLGSIDGINGGEDSVNVGIGTDTPDSTLHVRNAPAGGVAATVEEGILDVRQTVGSGARIRFANGTQDWAFRNAGNNVFVVTDETNSQSPFKIYPGSGSSTLVVRSGRWGLGVESPSHPIHALSGAFLSSGGVWTDASSRDLKTDINSLSVERAVEVLRAMDPVTYTYKKDPGESHVGFIAEDVPELVASAGRKGLSPMDIVAVAVRVLQQAMQRLDALEASQAGD